MGSIVSRAVPEKLRSTLVPPVGAGPLRVAVSVTGPPPSTGVDGSAVSVRAVAAPSLSAMVSVRVFDEVSFGLALVAPMTIVSPGSTNRSSRTSRVVVPLVAPGEMSMEIDTK